MVFSHGPVEAHVAVQSGALLLYLSLLKTHLDGLGYSFYDPADDSSCALLFGDVWND